MSAQLTYAIRYAYWAERPWRVCDGNWIVATYRTRWEALQHLEAKR